ncbi:ester cyclase [Paracraurococcus ruber]|uniref:ester cyclase n=1 Tax=Paracraurococcus ruber TaxID=77675 RepID=UPI001057B23F|nr:ester cyclase [Paracraurococcus ruber]TDG33703.1 hypothetical protein E2C05_02460 [Paracraurococcus ruber]
MSRHAEVAKTMDCALTRSDAVSRLRPDDRTCPAKHATERALRDAGEDGKTWLVASSGDGGEGASAMNALDHHQQAQRCRSARLASRLAGQDGWQRRRGPARRIHTAFADHACKIEDIVQDAPRVAARMRLSGRNKGMLVGVAARGAGSPGPAPRSARATAAEARLFGFFGIWLP